MIIKSVSKIVFWTMPRIVGGIVLLAFLVWVLVSLRQQSSDDDKTTILFCDAEVAEGNEFITPYGRFTGGHQQTDEFARSGRFSCFLSSQNKYGLESSFPVSDHVSKYKVSVWRYNPNQVSSWLVATTDSTDQFYQARALEVESNSDQWELVQIIFEVPDHVSNVKVYCYTTDDAEKVYFDDLTVEKLVTNAWSGDYDIPQLDIVVSQRDYRKLAERRNDAWRKGLLIKEDTDWVDGTIAHGNQTWKAKFRLKGDWLDHLKNEKWSFRIDIRGPGSFLGMRTFNIQSPDTRGFMNEWLYHQMLARENLLSPRYRFIIVKLNDKMLGIYACEEHFEKELLEFQGRREGPILKFNEEQFWQNVLRQFDIKGKNQIIFAENKERAFWNSDIRAFSEKHLQSVDDLSTQFSRAQDLLLAFKYGLLPFDEIFDIPQLGKFLAIIDITQAYHSLTWHNQRWYYNPLTGLLEPVGFDGYTEEGVSDSPGLIITAEKVYHGLADEYEPFRKFFFDPGIVKEYAFWLEKFTREQYLHDFLIDLEEEMHLCINQLRVEYPDFSFSLTDWRDHIRKVRFVLLPHQETSVFCRRSVESGEVYISNRHSLPVEIKGFGTRNIMYEPDSVIVLFPVSFKNVPEFIPVSSPGFTDKVFFSPVGVDTVFSSTIVEWEPPVKPDPDKLSPSDIFESGMAHVAGKEIYLQSGVIDRSLIIPEGYQVVLTPGTQIKLGQSASIFSSSPIMAIGEEENPILFQGMDNSGGIVLMKCNGMSRFEHVLFENLGVDSHYPNSFTGGVSAYESDLIMKTCQFRQSASEDALNVIRSDFQVINCSFDQIFFDALDSDFSTGTITGCQFSEIGNDAIDLSGSRVKIVGCKISNAGDKGISVGEESIVEIRDVFIQGANIALASKDLSEAVVHSITIENSNQGLTAYQKKAAYGPAIIRVEDHQFYKVKYNYRIETGSRLIVKGREKEFN